MKPPAPRPCSSCPYRRDVPSGVWDRSEYLRLPRYDFPTWAQPPGVFLCHQQDGKVCAGWAACHDMDENLALRLAAAGGMSREALDAIRDYTTDVALFGAGGEAAAHGLRDLAEPGEDAQALIDRLSRKRKA